MKLSLALLASTYGEEVFEDGWEVGCRLKLNHEPAFAYYDERDATLYYTSFSPVGSDAVYRVKDFDSDTCDSNSSEQIINRTFPWPNSIEPVPEEAGFGDGYWSVASGFFPQNKNDGCIGIFHEDSPNDIFFLTPGCNHIQGDHEPWFYHKIEWVDMNNDGKLDILTARAFNSDPVTPERNELLWLENNGSLPSGARKWREHVIAADNHGDVFFDVAWLPHHNRPNKEQMVIGVGSFYQQKLELIWTNNDDNNWQIGSQQGSVILDTEGWYFDVHFTDVNNDGELDLLTTTWSRNHKPGKTIAYSLDMVDFTQKENWSAHEIFGDFPTFRNAGLGSPGGFSLDRQEGGKDIIYVSGDDDGRVYVHTPLSEDSSDWSYKTHTIYQTDPNVGALGATIGEINAMDINGDGKTQILIPHYTNKEILVLKQTEEDPEL